MRMLQCVLAVCVLTGPFSFRSADGQLPTIHEFFGESSRDHFGVSVSGAGDVDRDGFSDVIIGTRPGDGVTPALGHAIVLSGRDGSVIHHLVGPSEGDLFGTSVSGAGDVDGDGYADVIVGAQYYSDREAYAGAAWVFSGFDGSIIHAFFGKESNDRLGSSVSGAGDVNGDGLGDVIVGSYFESSTAFWSGSARVFSGRNGTILHRWDGQAAYDFFGKAVSGAGDVDADGFDDVIVGAYDEDGNGFGSGSARVFSGRTGDVLYTLHGALPAAHFGVSLSGIGDVNLDGHADWIVGAWEDDRSAPGAGSATVFSGKDGSILFENFGDSENDHFGYSVSGAGDLNGDAIPDFVVGTYFGENDLGVTGMARLFSGEDGSELVTYYGDEIGGFFGYSVSGVGDTNGDGLSEVIVGAPHSSPNGFDSGMARVLTACGAETYGHSSGPDSLALDWDSARRDVGYHGSAVISGGAPRAPGFVIVSTDRDEVSLGNDLVLWLDITSGQWIFIPISFDSAGSKQFAVDLTRPALSGRNYFAQAGHVQYGSLSLSNAIQLLFCR